MKTKNHIVQSMLLADINSLTPHLERVDHCSGDLFAERGDPIRYACFPEGAVTALLASTETRHKIAVGMIGHEGMVGSAALEGATHWHYDVCVRAANSTALRIEIERLLDLCRRSETLRELLLRFAGSLAVQVGTTSVANLIGSIERRLARWILLYHDRLPGDEITMTHEEISIMLGIRRASATDVLHILEGEQAVKSVRGRIIVRDRARLEAIAGEFYGDAEADYRRMIGEFGKGRAIEEQSRKVA